MKKIEIKSKGIFLLADWLGRADAKHELIDLRHELEVFSLNFHDNY